MYLPFFKICLVCTNFSILSFLLILVLEHAKANYNLLSWSTAFHAMSICWLTMRGCFWLFTISSVGAWSNVAFYSLYWMPHPFQFGAFMLLPLFFAQVAYPQEWRTYWAFGRPVYILLVFGSCIFQAIWAILAAVESKMESECENAHHPLPAANATDTALKTDDDECFTTDYSSAAFRLVAAALFLALAALQAIYSRQIAFLDKPQYQRFFQAPQPVLNGVNLALFVSFLTRGLYQFGTVWGLYVLPRIPLQGDEDVSPYVFICFELWDYLPTVLLVLTVTSRALGSGTRPPPQVGVVNPSVGETQRLLAVCPAYGADEESAVGVEMSVLRAGPLARFAPPVLPSPAWGPQLDQPGGAPASAAAAAAAAALGSWTASADGPNSPLGALVSTGSLYASSAARQPRRRGDSMGSFEGAPGSSLSSAGSGEATPRQRQGSYGGGGGGDGGGNCGPGSVSAAASGVQMGHAEGPAEVRTRGAFAAEGSTNGRIGGPSTAAADTPKTGPIPSARSSAFSSASAASHAPAHAQTHVNAVPMAAPKPQRRQPPSVVGGGGDAGVGVGGRGGGAGPPEAMRGGRGLRRNPGSQPILEAGLSPSPSR